MIAKSSAYQPITAEDAWFEGEDQELEFTIWRKSTNAPENITGWTIQWKLAATKGGTALLTKTATLVTPAGGVCKVTIAAADTTGLGISADTTYQYALARTDAGANHVLAYGEALLQARPS